MDNIPPPPAEELAILDRELAQLDARRAQLLARRAWLLAVVSQRVAPSAPMARPLAAPVPDAAPRSVQNLLLILGGVLLTVAAIAFTLVSWGHLGIGGRSAVLGAVTVAALSAPVALLRRGLVSTAESVAGLGLALTVLDAYALHRVALADIDGLGYAASASAALAALWSAYGLSLDRLRIPLPMAVLTAQLPLPLWALTAGPGAPPMEWALLATAALDVAVALWAKPGLRDVAATGAAVTGGWALLIGGAQSVTADTPLDAVAPAALLVAAAGVALFAAWRSPAAAAPCSAVAGIATIAALGGVARAGVPEGWSVLGYLLCAVALLGLVRTGAPQRLRPGLTAATGAVHAIAAVLTLPLVALTLAGPLSTTNDIWLTTPPDARDALGVPFPESGLTASPLVLLIVAATLAAASRWWPSTTDDHSAAATVAPGTAGTAAATDVSHTTAGSASTPSAAVGSHPTGANGESADAPDKPKHHDAQAPGAQDNTQPPGAAGTPAHNQAADASTSAKHHNAPAGDPDQAPSSPDSTQPRSTTGHPHTAGAHNQASDASATAKHHNATGAPRPSGTSVGAPWSSWAPPSAARVPAAPRPDRRAAAVISAVALAWAGLFIVPPALDLGYAATVTLHLLLTAAALALAVRPAWTARLAPAGTGVALGCALAGAVSVAVLSLATRPATFTVLGTLTAALVAAAIVSRGPLAVTSVVACAATGFATALLGAVAAVGELPPHRAALLILAVPAAVALFAARLRRHPVALPLELTGAVAGLLAIALASDDEPTLALVLALGGVIAAATAVRPERRPAAGFLAAVLFVLATWMRLHASDVGAPEAYTLPVTLPALAVGLLRRRRDPEASSWTAYGPGLAATLLPSLVAAWGDDHWLRPLLLGLAALAVTLTGARLRLQALLVLGGAVLALDALHELAPYVVQVVGALPRWLVPALAGLLLLAIGATYEQRLRDARRLRDSLGRMR